MSRERRRGPRLWVLGAGALLVGAFFWPGAGGVGLVGTSWPLAADAPQDPDDRPGPDVGVTPDATPHPSWSPVSAREHPGDVEGGPGVLVARRDAIATPPRALQRLAGRIQEVASAPRWQRARLGILARDGETGETLFSQGADSTLVPASNLKILTTAAALYLLGPDYRWVTWVTTEAPIVDGVVQGDVVLYGTGDPGLEPSSIRDPSAFDALAETLLDAGIRRIDGRIVGDASYFSGPERVEDWDPRDLNDWFAAASTALSYNENVVQLRVEATEAEQPPEIHSDPSHGGFGYENLATTVPSRPRERMHVLRDEPLDPIRIVGHIARGGRDVYRTMTVQDPPLFAAHGFQAALERAGIAVGRDPIAIRDRAQSALSPARVFTGGQHRVLARHRSPPLIEALAVVNLESHNLYADLVLKTLGRVFTGEGSFEAGARVIERFAVDEVGVAPGALTIRDGSGLAATNSVTPEAMVEVLRHILSSPFGEAFLATLPEAGTRQLRRMERTAAARNLRAKTGTIEGVSALSGLVYSADGRPIVFSIIGNGFSSAWGAKRLEDDIGAVLAEWSSTSADPAADPG